MEHASVRNVESEALRVNHAIHALFTEMISAGGSCQSAMRQVQRSVSPPQASGLKPPVKTSARGRVDGG